MTLENLAWDNLQVFLTNDLKMSSKASALQANKSRFKLLRDYFVEREFNRICFSEFVASMKIRGLKPSTMNNFLKMAKTVEKYLETTIGRKRELDEVTYFTEYYDKEEIDVLTPDEIIRIANVQMPYKKYRDFLNKRNYVFIMLMGTTGCRVGEAIDLNYEDVRTQPRPYVVFKDTKNGQNRRVAITKGVYIAIMELSDRKVGNVFLSGRSGNTLRDQAINLDIKARAKACGINKKIHCHTIRHSFITTLLDAGVDSLQVAQIVGHSDPKTTLRYSHTALIKQGELLQAHPLFREDMTSEEREKSIIESVTRKGKIVSQRTVGNFIYLKVAI